MFVFTSVSPLFTTVNLMYFSCFSFFKNIFSYLSQKKKLSFIKIKIKIKSYLLSKMLFVQLHVFNDAIHKLFQGGVDVI